MLSFFHHIQTQLFLSFLRMQESRERFKAFALTPEPLHSRGVDVYILKAVMIRFNRYVTFEPVIHWILSLEWIHLSATSLNPLNPRFRLC